MIVIKDYLLLGLHISEFCNVLIKKRDMYKESVCCKFNGLEITADENSTVDSLVTYYHDNLIKKPNRLKGANIDV